jgi:multiple sugar transport system substrate-binding protein
MANVDQLQPIAFPEPPAPADGVPRRVMTRDEMLRFLDFMEEIEAEADEILPLRVGDPVYRIMCQLIRADLERRMVTVTALAAASGAPYATAMRRIEEMVSAGLIIRRPRTRTGKSFSLHPSRELIDAWYDYGRRIKRVIAKTFGRGGDPSELYDYYFGGSYMSARIIAPPAVRDTPLPLPPPLRTLVHADPTFMAMESLKRQFEQLFGTPIRSRALSIDRLRREALKNAEAKCSRYDVIAVDLPWIGEFATKNVLMPLDGELAKGQLHRSDFHASAWRGCNYNGLQYGVPIQITPEFLLYREDVFAEAGLKPPATVDEVLTAARQLHAPHQGRRGIAWNAARGTALGHTFIMVMAAFGQPVLDLAPLGRNFDPHRLEGRHRRPMIATPEGRQTAEYLLNLLAYSPPNILSMSWFERVAAYGSGEVAMAYGYTLLAPYFELDKNSPARGTTGYLPHPRGPKGRNLAPVGGYALGIPANLDPQRVPGAFHALELFTSPEACKLYLLNGSLVSPRFSVSADPEVRAISKVVSIVDEYARTGQLQLWPRPPAPEISDVITICGEELHDMCRGLKSVAEALAEAQNRADRLMREAGHY